MLRASGPRLLGPPKINASETKEKEGTREVHGLCNSRAPRANSIQKKRATPINVALNEKRWKKLRVREK